MVDVANVKRNIENGNIDKREIYGGRKTVHQLKEGIRFFGEGLAVEWQNMTADMKQDFGFMKNITKETFLHPWKLARDIKKGANLLAQGKFKELRGKSAQRLAANLKARGLLGEGAYVKLSERIEKRTGVVKGQASDLSKAYEAWRVGVKNRGR